MTHGTLLLVDVGARDMAEQAVALRAMGYRALRAKSVEEGLGVLGDDRYPVGAALVPPDLPALDLERALIAFRSTRPGVALPLLACGREPDSIHRDRMRSAGVELALWDPVAPGTLRFQVNRALAGDSLRAVRRRAKRAPASLGVTLRVGSRHKPADLYTLSPVGAYLATDRPTLPKTLVHVTLELPDGPVIVPARVMMTNVPGNLAKPNLPAGMGVRFTGHTAEIFDRLQEFTEERAQALLV